MAEEMSPAIMKVAASMDIITDILSRVPVKSLLRFRCVSKLWCSFIDTSEFAKLHLNRSIKTKSNLSVILYNRNWGWIYSVDFDKLDKAVELENPLKKSVVLASCNGLLLLKGFTIKENSLALYNPATRKHKVIPVCPFFSHYLFGGDPRGGPYGLGYDASNDDYKIISVVEYVDKKSGKWIGCDTKIYSLNSNEWKPMKDFPFKLGSCMKEWGVHMRGAIHSLVKRNGNVDDGKCDDVILVTDLVKEDYSFMELPCFHGKDVAKLLLYVLGVEEYLCLEIIYKNVWTDFWLMKKYGVRSSWTKLFSVDPFEIPRYEFLDVVCFSKEYDKVLFILDDTKICWYDLKRKKIVDIPVQDLPKPEFNVELCVGSLVRPDGSGKRKENQPTAQRNMAVKGRQTVEEKQTKKKRDGFLSKGFKLKL